MTDRRDSRKLASVAHRGRKSKRGGIQQLFQCLGPAWTLSFVLLLAAGLRLYRLVDLPAGLHTDEAANAWNGYCLLKTGKDQHGAPWPVFYLRAFGDNRSALFAYMLLPFQAIGGLNEWTTRLPGSIGGILSVFLLYWIGAKLFGREVGLVAAGLLAVNPWHLQQCRWGHEAAIVPLLVLLPITCLLWAGVFPINTGRSKPAAAAVAGVVAGLSCYGYPAVRFFLPVFLAFLMVAFFCQRHRVEDRLRLKAVGIFMLFFLMLFIPLVWQHATNEEINKRAQTTWVWADGDSGMQKLMKAFRRYPGHFGPDFLFVHGDRDIALSPPEGFGLFLWDSLLWMLVGSGFLITTLKSSVASRWLVLWLVTYPAGDLLSRHVSLHALRSLPGSVPWCCWRLLEW